MAAPTEQPASSVALEQYVSKENLLALMQMARREDMGPDGLDLASAAMIPANATGQAALRSRVGGRLAGAALLPSILSAYSADMRVDAMLADGAELRAGDSIALIHGPLNGILAVERVALNFLSHLCGIATLTNQYVQRVRGTRARICDTRKTIPGLRALQKYATACGGAQNHRMGLHDAALIKDNHLSGVRADRLAATVGQAVRQLRRGRPAPAFVEVEVDHLDQLNAVLTTGVDMVLLDNMDLHALERAVAIRNEAAPDVLLEASGGITLENVRDVAQTGVDRISVGAITHSAPAIDLTLEVAVSSEK